METAGYPLVSVLVRTCGRPQVLKRALDSIREQTYPAIEVIIVEDGTNAAEKMLQKEYRDLNYIYEASGEHIGRSKAGNRAMQLASGTYLNFLDDDDGLLPGHIACLVSALNGRKEKAAYSVAQERQAAAKTGIPQVKRRYIRYRQPFHRLLLCTWNYIPIQSILFEKSLFDAYGGMDEAIGMMEDWDLWVRYCAVTDFIFVDQVTSYYHVPYSRKLGRKRRADLRKDMEKLDKKFQSYQLSMTAAQVHQQMQYVMREYKNKGLARYIRMFFRMFVLGER